MPKLIGGIFAFVALAVCIINTIDPWTSVVRGLAAFAAGHFAGSLWESFFGQPGGKVINAEELVNTSNDENGHTIQETTPQEEPAA